MGRTVTTRTDVRELRQTVFTDPAINEAVSTDVVDNFSAVIITTTTTGNAQVLQDPTDTTQIKRFTVINDDTSTNTISVNGVDLDPGQARYSIWDGTAWADASAGGGGLAWGNSRINGTGIGLLHTIGANAASGVQSFKTTVNDTQTNALDVVEVDLGTSALVHSGIKITDGGNGSCAVLISTAVSSNSIDTRGVEISAIAAEMADYKGVISVISSTDVSIGHGSVANAFTSARTVASANTVLDTYDVVTIRRISTVNNASADFTSVGAALAISNTVNPTLGTLVDTAEVLRLTQDTDSTGPHIIFSAQTNGSVGDADGQFWYNGTNLRLRTAAANFDIPHSNGSTGAGTTANGTVQVEIGGATLFLLTSLLA